MSDSLIGRALLFAGLLWVATPAQALVLVATADTHVEEKDSGANFGNFPENRSGRAFDAEGANALRLLLQFDASGLPAAGSIGSATLRLFISDTTSDPLGLPIVVLRLLSTFVEGDGLSGVTWATQPGSAPTPGATGTMNRMAGEWFEIDVTQVVRAALASGDTPGTIPLVVRAVDEETNEDREFSVYSKEFGDGSLRAQLVIDLAAPVPLLSLAAVLMLVATLIVLGTMHRGDAAS